ncbi:hypothetical protein ACIRJR_04765 [Streptomyces sp. NPDC102402]|uniref:hypothetical protein n=1 Tax=Streptomyces sp. NPDC102402 TaxID=3366169 RepID=UPI00380F444E
MTPDGMKRMPLTRGSDRYNEARDAMMEIIMRWAAARRTDNYKTLSAELAAEGFAVPYFSKLMSELLESACREADRAGAPGMLTAIVVNNATSRPSQQFFTLAEQSPFRRQDRPGWEWEAERDIVFEHAQTEAAD